MSVQKEILRRVLQSWLSTRDYVFGRDFQPRIAHELFPHDLRANVDDALLGLSLGTEGVETSTAPNKTNTSYHTLIAIPKIKMTASAVRSPRARIRIASFRNKYARLQSKFELDEDKNELRVDDSVAPEDAVLYAIIVHGPEPSGDRYANSFVDIVFLDQDGSQLDQRIRLKDENPDVVESVFGVEIVPDEVRIEPIRVRKEVS